MIDIQITTDMGSRGQQLIDRADKQIRREFSQAMEEIVREGKESMPVDTGEAKQSFAVEVEGGSGFGDFGAKLSGVDYIKQLDAGHSSQAATGFLTAIIRRGLRKMTGG